LTILPGISHCDHVTAEILAFLARIFADRTGPFIETIELPPELGPICNALYGPAVGDPPITEDQVYYACRPGRLRPSRLVARPPRPTYQLTVIAGLRLDLQTGIRHECALITCFGGPHAPREVCDLNLSEEELEQCRRFWAEHALAEPR
jgi:hypothetical protein